LLVFSWIPAGKKKDMFIEPAFWAGSYSPLLVQRNERKVLLDDYFVPLLCVPKEWCTPKSVAVKPWLDSMRPISAALQRVFRT